MGLVSGSQVCSFASTHPASCSPPSNKDKAVVAYTDPSAVGFHL